MKGTRFEGRYPKFRPMPIRFRSGRPKEQKDYGRFYGNYNPLHEKTIKRFSFQVKTDMRNPRLLGRLMRITCGKIVRNNIPLAKTGQTFDSFGDLLHRTPWIKVKKVRNYHAGVIYKR